MSLLQMVAACLLPFLVANASPSDLSAIVKRDPGTPEHSKLIRRHDYIESSGVEVNVTITIPRNDAASSNQTLAAHNTKIPYTSLVSSAFSAGGGNGETISGGFFAGRKSGMGTRNEIYGSARYGSGYGTYKVVNGKTEYTPEFTLNVAGRSFPFGYMPISWGNYSGGQEYLDGQLSDYPGITPPQPFENHRPTTISKLYLALNFDMKQQWFIIADGDTLDLLNEVLQLPVTQGGCATRNVSPLSAPYHEPVVNASTIALGDNYTGSFDNDVYWNVPDYPFGPYPWNIIQYYRGSSIALGVFAYNNTFSHNGNSNPDYWAASPLNTTRTGTTPIDMEYLKCINTTIAAVAPIVNPSLIVIRRSDGLNAGQIAGVVVGTVVGLALILVGAWIFLRRRRQNNQPASVAVGATSTRPRSSSIKKSLGLGEKTGTYQLVHHHRAPSATDGATSTSSHEPGHV